MAMKRDGSNTAIQVLAIKGHDTIAVGASSVSQGATYGEDTVVRLVSSTDCHITTAASPTATTSHMFLPANVVDFLLVPNGQQIAAIQNSASGTLYITELE